MARFELEQGGMVVASVDGGPRDAARADIYHYGLVYGQDGPCVAYEVRGRKRIKLADFPRTPDPGASHE